MRYTEEPDQLVLEVPAGETWVGIVDAPKPYVGIAARLDDGERVIVTRLSAREAIDLANELARLAHDLHAKNN